MEIRLFLEKHVEGYLFEDLASMAHVGLAPGKTAGAVGYPMVATALAGIELLGSLMDVGKFNSHAGWNAFKRFWTEYLYPSPPRDALAGPLYQLARHGLAHVFLAKPGITVVKHNDATRHLCRDDAGALLIDAIVLSDDLRRAYWERVRPRLSQSSPPSATTMQERLDEMIEDYRTKAEAYRSHLRRVPPAPSKPAESISVNSPTVNGYVSMENTSTSPASLPPIIVGPKQPGK